MYVFVYRCTGTCIACCGCVSGIGMWCDKQCVVYVVCVEVDLDCVCIHNYIWLVCIV